MSEIHKHYNRNNDTICDPNDEQDLKVVRDKHKKRCCIAAAILGCYPRILDFNMTKDKLAWFMGQYGSSVYKKQKSIMVTTTESAIANFFVD